MIESSEHITIRKATRDDAEFIVRGFLTAMWMSDAEQEKMLPICAPIAAMDDTLYSWRNARIAQVDGRDAAVLIAYDGAGYAAMARTTFTIVRDNGGEDFTQMTAEAAAGEWYIDTLAVLPCYRHKGIGTALLKNAIHEGMATEGIMSVTLYVDPEHPQVMRLYHSVGFEPAGDAVIFNQLFTKMVITRDKGVMP